MNSKDLWAASEPKPDRHPGGGDLRKLPKCQGMRDDGKTPCKAVALKDSHYCRSHHPQALRIRNYLRKEKRKLKNLMHGNWLSDRQVQMYIARLEKKHFGSYTVDV